MSSKTARATIVFAILLILPSIASALPTARIAELGFSNNFIYNSANAADPVTTTELTVRVECSLSGGTLWISDFIESPDKAVEFISSRQIIACPYTNAKTISGGDAFYKDREPGTYTMIVTLTEEEQTADRLPSRIIDIAQKELVILKVKNDSAVPEIPPAFALLAFSMAFALILFKSRKQ